MNEPQAKRPTVEDVIKDNPFLAKPADAVQSSNDLQKQLQDDCAAMRDDEDERLKAPHDRFELAAGARNIHRFVLPEGHKIEDMLETDYWTHVAVRLRALDHIEVNPDDGSFYAELIVRSTRFGMIETAVIRYVNFGYVNAADALPQSAYKVEFKGPHEKWCVLEHDQVLQSKFETEGSAIAWAQNYQRAQRS